MPDFFLTLEDQMSNPQLFNVGDDYRAIITDSDAGAKTLREIVAEALGSKSGAAAVLPDKVMLETTITPNAAITYMDIFTNDEVALAQNVSKTFAFINAIDRIRVKGEASVTVEIIFQTKFDK